MANIIKYSTTGVTNTVSKGNFYLGVNSDTGGPTSTTGFWNGIQPPLSGYTLYGNKNDAFGPSINVFNNDTELISFVNQRGGNVSTISGAINYFSSNDEFILVNKDYEDIITDGLILNLDAGFSASYPNSGTTWYDLSLSGNNATLIGGVSYNLDLLGNLVFDGTTGYCTINNSDNLVFGTSDFTISIYIKTPLTSIGEGSPSQWGPILSKGCSTSAPAGTWWLAQTSTSSSGITFNASSTTGGTFVTSLGTTLPDGWHNIVVSRSGTTIFLYKNGVYINSDTTSDTNLSSTSALYIGNNMNLSSKRTGMSLSNVKIYNRALTSEEILQNYNAIFYQYTNTLRNRVQSDGGYYEDNSNYTIEILKNI